MVYRGVRMLHDILIARTCTVRTTQKVPNHVRGYWFAAQVPLIPLTSGSQLFAVEGPSNPYVKFHAHLLPRSILLNGYRKVFPQG